MSKGILGSLLTLLITAGPTLAQSAPAPSTPISPRSLPAAGTSPVVNEASQAPADVIAHPEPIVADGEDASSCEIPGRFWAGAEYLMWWTRDDRAPPLLTTGPLPLPVGVLGDPNTAILLGGRHLDHETYSGARFTGGVWLGACNSIGLEGSYFFLGQKVLHREVTSATVPVLARPFFDLSTGVPSSSAVAIPGTSTGRFGFANPSRLQGAEANAIMNTTCADDYRIDLLAGFRYLDLSESLTATQFLQLNPNGPNPALAGTQTTITDAIATQNHFYGGQVGVGINWALGPFVLDLRAKVALGTNQQRIAINGSRQVNSEAGSFTVPFGQLALTSNIGRFQRDAFAVVPEIGINLGYQATEHIGLFTGYSFLSYHRVVRPGQQIDLVTNTTQIPGPGLPAVLVGPAHPAVLFSQSDFWAQGINFGLELVW